MTKEQLIVAIREEFKKEIDSDLCCYYSYNDRERAKEMLDRAFTKALSRFTEDLK